MLIFVGETLLIRLVFIGSNMCEPSSSEIQGEVWITEGGGVFTLRGGFVEIGGGGVQGLRCPLVRKSVFRRLLLYLARYQEKVPMAGDTF